MSTNTQLSIAASSGGRVLLHLAAMSRDHKMRWHLAGIGRELRHTWESAAPRLHHRLVAPSLRANGILEKLF
jgi:hypothetical protein